MLYTVNRLQMKKMMAYSLEGIYIVYTVNPFCTDTRYNKKIRFNDNLTGKKNSLRSWQFIRNELSKNSIFNISRKICFGY